MPPEDKILDILITRQDAIFAKLEEMDGTLKTVAVQKNEIDHLNADMTDVKQTQDEHARRLVAVESRVTAAENSCALNHPKDAEPTLISKMIHTAVLTSVAGVTMFIIGLVGLTLYRNLADYLDFNRTQINGEPAKKVR